MARKTASRSQSAAAAKKTAPRKKAVRRKPAVKQRAAKPQAAAAESPVCPAEHARLATLCRQILRTRRRARALYREAEGLMSELVEEAGVGSEFDLGKGRTAIIVDQFARGRTVFKRVGFDRFDLEVLE